MHEKSASDTPFLEGRHNGSAPHADSGGNSTNRLPRAKMRKPRKRSTNAAAKGVEDAYRLIERHILEGRRAAMQANQRTYAVATERHPQFEAFIRDSARMLGAAAEYAVSVTADLIGTLLRDGNEESASPVDEVSAVAGLSVEIVSTRPTHVTLNLRGGDLEALALKTLWASDPHKPPLSDVEINSSRDSENTTVRIRIGPEQPSDSYSGTLVDARTGELRGQLTVRISD